MGGTTPWRVDEKWLELLHMAKKHLKKTQRKQGEK
jgi:hypothetical protein